MGLLPRKEKELTNSCERLPIHSVALISSPKNHYIIHKPYK